VSTAPGNPGIVMEFFSYLENLEKSWNSVSPPGNLEKKAREKPA